MCYWRLGNLKGQGTPGTMNNPSVIISFGQHRNSWKCNPHFLSRIDNIHPVISNLALEMQSSVSNYELMKFRSLICLTIVQSR